jgi:hypothetical protein
MLVSFRTKPLITLFIYKSGRALRNGTVNPFLAEPIPKCCRPFQKK